MNEAEWAACTDPQTMLTEVGLENGARKVRLFACACLRRLWNRLPDDRSRLQVETAELFADGKAGKVDLLTARGTGQPPPAFLGKAAWCAAVDPIDLPFSAIHVLENIKAAFRQKERPPERRAQADLARDIFNPERPPRIEAAWLRWQDGTVRRLAESIYESRRFEELPMLADALEEAGCDDRDILEHCRSGGVHARGCRVIDVLLGKK